MPDSKPRDVDVVSAAVPSSPAEGDEGVLGPGYRALSVGIVSVVLLIAFEATAVGTAMPVAARELDGVSLYAFAFSGYFTTSLFGMVLSGQWSDRRGPLGPLTTGIASFGAGLLLSGTAGAMWVFILGRAVQGFGGGLVIVALYVVVGRAYPERLRPAIMAAFAASWVLPSIVGPLAAGTVTEQLGWRWVFVGIPVLVVFPLALALPQIRRRAAGPAEHTAAESAAAQSADLPVPAERTALADRPVTPDAAGRPAPPAEPPASFDRRRIRLALGISLGAGLLQYAAQDLRLLSLLPGAVGVALLVPAVLGLLPRGTYRAARGLPSVVLLRGVAAGSFIAAESFVPLMLVTQRGLSPTLAGFSLAAGGGTWALGSWVQSRPRVEPYRERLTTVGMLLVAAAVAAAPSVLIESVPVWTLAVAWAFGCFGMGLVISSTSVLLLKLSAPEEAGTNSAALQISDGLSNVVLLSAGGAAFAALGGGAVSHTATHASGSHPAAFTAVFLPMAAVALAGAWVSTRLRERRR
ncbi:MFS transporter [Streptomyces sp. NEAU-H22]|uniref:MFS transporter n=1 Tax=unclassified Streptomyces TaxID=2593676 RepID=UPI00224FA69B|nr:MULTISPECIES: MFS transporter [unclassified Streptomyces]MCX3285984.1 MFS transporter [Streptomyces sp. NEAU-H22]WMD09049.1 MFS transporter [Streptomyces sp. FXY-T5]